MEDGPRAHTTKLTQKCHKDKINLLPLSPGISFPIENVWWLMNSALFKKNPTTMDDVKKEVVKEGTP